MKDTADLFIELQNPEDEFWKDKPEVRQALKELKLFQIRQTNSLLIAGYKNVDNNQFKKLTKVCKGCQIFMEDSRIK